MSNYDLFSREFKRNPFPVLAAMRAADPIYPHISPSGHTIWYITRYADVMTVLRDSERFCKNPANALPLAPAHSVHGAINQNMLFSDPPDHTRLRALVNQAFTPRRVEAMAADVARVTDSLLDAVAARGAMDLIADLALPLPVIVICDMLGIPRQDQAEISELSQIIISPSRSGLSHSGRRRKMREFVDYLRGLFAERQARPQDDLTTALVQAEEAGERLSEAELSSMVALLLVTGHETTVNLIGNGALALLQHPEQLALVRERPVLWEAAIEELLRFDGPVETSTTRWVRQDTVFEGHAMQRGDLVRAVLASANRDAAVFQQPDSLVIERGDSKRHLAFGHGIHYCLGAPLARLEGRVALAALFNEARFPGLRLSSRALRWRSGVLFRGLEALPLVWD